METRFHPNSPVVSMNYAAILVTFLEQKGIDRNSLLRGTNISEDDLSKSENFASLAQFQTLFNRAYRLTGDEALGLHFGEQLNIASHGFLGYAIMSSKNALTALDVAMKYIKIRNRLISINIVLEDDFAVLNLTTSIKRGSFNRFMVEHAFSSLNSIVSFLSGIELKIEKFCFDYPEPNYIQCYESVLKKPVSFNHSNNQVFLHAMNFNHVSALSDPQLAAIAEKQCEALLATIDSDVPLPDRIRKVVLQTAGQFPSSDFIAKQMGMSPRTMSRQLNQCNTTFKQIIDELKLNRAIEYLSTTSWSIDEIADLLDYSDPSNFRRAFKKWMGQSPSQYRESLNSI